MKSRGNHILREFVRNHLEIYKRQEPHCPTKNVYFFQYAADGFNIKFTICNYLDPVPHKELKTAVQTESRKIVAPLLLGRCDHFDNTSPSSCDNDWQSGLTIVLFISGSHRLSVTKDSLVRSGGGGKCPFFQLFAQLLQSKKNLVGWVGQWMKAATMSITTQRGVFNHPHSL